MAAAEPIPIDVHGLRAELVLASRSAIRATLLQNAGLEFTAIGSSVDEDELKRSFSRCGGSTEELAETLADLKARRVGARRPGAFVIGADQILDCEGVRYDKPTNRETARKHLLALRGKTHRLITAVCVTRDTEALWRHIEAARLTMRMFDESFLDAYLDAMNGQATETVGGYRLEGIGAQLFESIDGDFFTILGLPLLPLLGFLREHGLVP